MIYEHKHGYLLIRIALSIKKIKDETVDAAFSIYRCRSMRYGYRNQEPD